MAIYFDTGVSCASCGSPVVRPTDASEPRPSCQCAERTSSERDESQMGSWRDGLALGAMLLGLVLVAAVLHGCAPRPPHTLAAPENCTYAPLPLRVYIDPEAALHAPALFSAAEQWTRALGKGKPALVFVSATDPDVVVSMGSAGSSKHRVLVTTYCDKGGTKRAKTTMTLDSGLDAVAIHDFAVHGFGHALGVAHSTNRQSVMQAQLETGLLAGEPGPDEELPPVYRVTEIDALAVLAQKRWRP